MLLFFHYSLILAKQTGEMRGRPLIDKPRKEKVMETQQE
jgi:hypothetical protein